MIIKVLNGGQHDLQSFDNPDLTSRHDSVVLLGVLGVVQGAALRANNVGGRRHIWLSLGRADIEGDHVGGD